MLAILTVTAVRSFDRLGGWTVLVGASVLGVRAGADVRATQTCCA